MKDPKYMYKNKIDIVVNKTLSKLRPCICIQIDLTTDLTYLQTETNFVSNKKNVKKVKCTYMYLPAAVIIYLTWQRCNKATWRVYK